MESDLIATDLYLRITTRDGDEHYEHRRVWDSARCAEAVRTAYKRQDEKDGRPGFTRVTVATQRDYRNNR